MEKIRILIVEDEGLIARDIEDMVRNAGYEVCAVVGTGEDAVEKGEESRPDLTVMETRLYKHQMEIKLRERQGWLSTILQSIGEGVIATERFGNITFMNAVAEKLTSWTQRDSIGKPLTSVLHLEH